MTVSRSRDFSEPRGSPPRLTSDLLCSGSPSSSSTWEPPKPFCYAANCAPMKERQMQEFRLPHSKWNPEYIITKHHAPNGRVVSCGLKLTWGKKTCIWRSLYSNLHFQVPRGQLRKWSSEDAHPYTGIQITSRVVKKAQHLPSAITTPTRSSREVSAPCPAKLAPVHIWADGAQIFC